MADNYNRSGNKGPFYFIIALVVAAALGLTAVYVAGSSDTDDLTAIESAAGGSAVDNDLDGIPDNQEVGDVNEMLDVEEDDTLVDIDNPQNESETSAEEIYEDSIDAVQEGYEDTKEAVEDAYDDAAESVDETADDVEEQLEEDAEAANDPNRPTASDDMQ